jgi:hypothetical protein
VSLGEPVPGWVFDPPEEPTEEDVRRWIGDARREGARDGESSMRSRLLGWISSREDLHKSNVALALLRELREFLDREPPP